jgi:hypothetical protein
MEKCCARGSTEIARGKIARSCEEFYSDIVFKPAGLRFLTLALTTGTSLAEESFACLACGLVWSLTNPVELREFIARHCKTRNPE